jgi:hypothetical protein
MSGAMAVRVIVLSLWVLLAGCSPYSQSGPQSGPQSVTETSVARERLSDRVEFIEQYVTFRRNYLDLEYDVMYQNNGKGLVPGPSDWDIRIRAVVPDNEIATWIPSDGTHTVQPPPAWTTTIPGHISTLGITEWYRVSGKEVGIDRATSTIAYRLRSCKN